jgi:hypothetical protein
MPRAKKIVATDEVVTDVVLPTDTTYKFKQDYGLFNKGTVLTLNELKEQQFDDSIITILLSVNVLEIQK